MTTPPSASYTRSFTASKPPSRRASFRKTRCLRKATRSLGKNKLPRNMLPTAPRSGLCEPMVANRAANATEVESDRALRQQKDPNWTPQRLLRGVKCRRRSAWPTRRYSSASLSLQPAHCRVGHGTFPARYRKPVGTSPRAPATRRCEMVPILGEEPSGSSSQSQQRLSLPLIMARTQAMIIQPWWRSGRSNVNMISRSFPNWSDTQGWDIWINPGQSAADQ